MALNILVNGEERQLTELDTATELANVLRELGLKTDRVAVEHNGQIAQRGRWNEILVREGDRLEVVHFVGGG